MRERALAEARRVGKKMGKVAADFPGAKEATMAKERRLFALGYLIALEEQEETSLWLGEEGERMCAGVEDDDIWSDAEEAWLAGFMEAMAN